MAIAAAGNGRCTKWAARWRGWSRRWLWLGVMAATALDALVAAVGGPPLVLYARRGVRELADRYRMARRGVIDAEVVSEEFTPGSTRDGGFRS
jgi:hypothetical protein